MPRSLTFAVLTAFLAVSTLAHAGSDRRGFLKFKAKYDGGYNVVADEASDGGASKIVIRSSRNGDTARILWKNTFYNELGERSDVRTVYTLTPDGSFFANTIDPRSKRASGSGTYTFKNRRINFRATDGARTATGTIRLVGGGALTIDMEIDGAVIEFHGGRK